MDTKCPTLCGSDVSCKGDHMKYTGLLMSCVLSVGKIILFISLLNILLVYLGYTDPIGHLNASAV